MLPVDGPVAYAHYDQLFYKVRIKSGELQSAQPSITKTDDGDAVLCYRSYNLICIISPLFIGERVFSYFRFAMTSCGKTDHLEIFCELGNKRSKLVNVSINTAVKHHQ